MIYSAWRRRDWHKGEPHLNQLLLRFRKHTAKPTNGALQQNNQTNKANAQTSHKAGEDKSETKSGDEWPRRRCGHFDHVIRFVRSVVVRKHLSLNSFSRISAR